MNDVKKQPKNQHQFFASLIKMKQPKGVRQETRQDSLAGFIAQLNACAEHRKITTTLF